MNKEQFILETSLEKPKAVTVERTSVGSISIELDKEVRDHFFDIIYVVQSTLEDKGLLEIIPNEEACTIEVRSFNPDGEITEEVMIEIQKQIDKINTIF